MSKLLELPIQLIDVHETSRFPAETEALRPAPDVSDRDRVSGKLMLHIRRELLNVGRPAELIGEIDDVSG